MRGLPWKKTVHLGLLGAVAICALPPTALARPLYLYTLAPSFGLYSFSGLDFAQAPVRISSGGSFTGDFSAERTFETDLSWRYGLTIGVDYPTWIQPGNVPFDVSSSLLLRPGLRLLHASKTLNWAVTARFQQSPILRTTPQLVALESVWLPSLSMNGLLKIINRWGAQASIGASLDLTGPSTASSENDRYQIGYGYSALFQLEFGVYSRIAVQAKYSMLELSAQSGPQGMSAISLGLQLELPSRKRRLISVDEEDE